MTLFSLMTAQVKVVPEKSVSIDDSTMSMADVEMKHIYDKIPRSTSDSTREIISVSAALTSVAKSRCLNK